jgi:urea transporter
MMAQSIRHLFPYFWQSLSNSYTQIFFSKNKALGALLIIVSFFDTGAGVAGMLSVFTANIAAYLIGLNRNKVIDGLYGFNALLVGLGLGSYYQLNIAFLVIVVFAALLTLIITGMLEGTFHKYGLPYLSLPFLAGIWIVSLATRQYTHLEISQKGIYSLNEMYLLGGIHLVHVYEWFHALTWPEVVKVYFRSLGAIFFQYHLFAGMVIAAGLIIWSRLAFLLSLIGFLSAWLFYIFIGASLSELAYSYIGFNYILTAIAIGGFFVIPSASSFLWTLLTVPMLAFLISAGNAILGPMQLGIFSLPFNLVVILTLYLFYLRERFQHKPTIVLYQQYSPERNLYNYLVNSRRLENLNKTPVRLPFYGTWFITQSFDGEHTHKDAWRFAWDFEMVDEEQKTYSDEGLQLSDYYCFAKPIVAPADGYISKIVDGIEDNLVGDANLKNNWGNTVVIYHATGLYTQMSHLKNGSITAVEGQFVKQGDQIALCGNSGRSPYPHLHFQLQATPDVGAATLKYPLSGLLKHGNSMEYFPTDTPVKGDFVSNLPVSELLHTALHFVPGQLLKFTVSENQATYELIWKTETDIFNNTSFHCLHSGAKAWFVRQPETFFFTHFEGDRNSVLFDFFLAGYQLTTGFVSGLSINENISLSYHPMRAIRILQDFVAPFGRFLGAAYRLEHLKLSNDMFNPRIFFKSEIEFSCKGLPSVRQVYHLEFGNGQLLGIKIEKPGKQYEITRHDA